MSKKAFTLVELMVAITIFFIVVGVSYAPYNYYMNKQKVRNTGKVIASSLYEARNMALGGVVGAGSNRSIGLYLEAQSDAGKIVFYSFPHDIKEHEIFPNESSEVQLLKSYELPKGIQIQRIGGKENMLFFFRAIDGNGIYYTYNSSQEKVEDDTIDIQFAFGNGDKNSPLFGSIKYLTKTHIVDY